MTTNIRELAERHLSVTLEGGYSLPVTLVSPDAEVQDDITGQVLYDTQVFNPDTGQNIVVNMPAVTLRLSSLSRVPVDGENWIIKIPIEPKVTADKIDFALSPTRSIEKNASIGFIRLYLSKVIQS